MQPEYATIVDYRGVELLQRDRVVLKNVDLTISSGEFLYLIGRVGSGKSTLLKSMYAEIPIAEGSAYVLGYDLTSMKRRDIAMLRRGVGIVFQDFRLLTDRSVEANLEFVLKATGWRDADERRTRIAEVLSLVGMESRASSMPHELSGGEQQRVVIARALLNSPKLLLADEPTGNLDPVTGEQIAGYLHQIAKQGTSVVMATHNLSLVQQFPGAVLRCEDRRIIKA